MGRTIEVGGRRRARESASRNECPLSCVYLANFELVTERWFDIQISIQQCTYCQLLLISTQLPPFDIAA